jgi:hypothetical protein
MTMFVMDVPDMPPQYTPVVIAQASQATEANATTGRTIGVCHLIENPPIPPETAVNSMSPALSVWGYLKKQERPTPGWLTTDVYRAAKVSILQGPSHGELKNEEKRDYRYVPTLNYYGQDRATLLVEMGDLKVKVMYFFNVMQSVPGGTEGYDSRQDKKNCPKGRMWKISLSTDGDPLAS